jgi:aspartate-semialdehyde dehydrogenase
MSSPIIAVVGATGLIGRQLVAALELHDVEPDCVRLLSTESSDGEELSYEEETLPVEKVEADSFRGVSAVILACPATASRTLAVQAQQSGAWVVDLSGAFRVDGSIPLVALGVNDAVLKTPFAGRVVSLVHPVAQALNLVLEPLRAKWGLVAADATLLCGASVHGNEGVERLSKQTVDLLSGKDPDLGSFPHRLAFNIVPEVGDFENGLCRLERHVLVELARIWSGVSLPAMTATAVLVPVFHGTTIVVSAHLGQAVEMASVRATFAAASSVKVLDEPEAHIYPMPMLANDDSSVHVGRIRVTGQRVQFVAASDTAFRAADSAVVLALQLVQRS